MKFITALVLAATLSGAAQAADLKIGVVDLNKAFAEYNKTKTAKEGLDANAAKAKEELTERFAALKKLNDEVEKKARASQDPVLGEQERAKSRAEAQTKAQEFKSLERDIAEFRQRRESQIQQQGMEQRRELYAEILKVVKEKSEAGKYDLVFDKSGLGALGLPFLIHSKEGVAEDFTSEVIVELNKAAPADAKPADAAAPAAAPAAEKK
jgi:outer membrane protein